MLKKEVIQADVVCVGAGVASISAAIRFLKRCKADPAGKKKPTVLIVEKGKRPGAHILSGSIIRMEPLQRLLSGEELASLPLESAVRSESLHFLTGKRHFKLLFVPPPMSSRGLPTASLSRVTARLAEICEALGGEIYADYSAAELLENETGFITGIRLGDKGSDKNGNPKPNFTPGAEIHAKMVVLGEGVFGTLTEKLIQDRKLCNPSAGQMYALGIKELIEIPARPELAGKIMHTFGWPLDCKTYGGGFVYGLNATQISIGLVTGLDYCPAELHLHNLFRKFKQHPLISQWIEGGKVVGYGAKALPEAGISAVPKLVTGGAMIIGDAAGLLDAVRLKGIHLAVESGIAAGDALFECWRSDDWSAAKAGAYPAQLEKTKAWKELKQFRNARPAFQRGLLAGMAAIGSAWLSRGLVPPGRIGHRPDHEGMKPNGKECSPPPAQNKVPDPDILTDLFYSGTEHKEDQPCHLIIRDPEICRTQCKPRFNAPCTRFCPAQVYEWDESSTSVKISPANCVHCKTCQIKDPLQNIEWRLPETGGPDYKIM
ncbi:MAG: 4Fe-4S dicluster domain-containing protein [Kiritimatiellia bacterium]